MIFSFRKRLQFLLKAKLRLISGLESVSLIMEAIWQAGLQIPTDISIVGFDDMPQASVLEPRLTTIQQPLEQMGQVAVELLLEQIEQPDTPSTHMTLPTELVVRESYILYRR